jgi:sugar phosphate isomerase/epimerase
MKLCVTSVMLPRWTLDETFDRAAACGFEGIEMRVRPNPEDARAEPSFWGRHVADVSPANVMAKVPAIRAAAKRSGLRVVALSPRVNPADEAGTAVLFEAARAISPDAPPMVRVDAPWYDRERPYLPQFDAVRAMLESASKRAKAAGVKLLYEIHAGTVAMTATRARALLEGMDPSAIGAIYDIPNLSRVGLEDTRQGVDALGPYLAHVHVGGARPVWKAGAVKDEWTFEFCGLKQGIADVPAILADLKRFGYAGFLSLEDFSPGDDETKLREQGAWLKGLLARLS